MSFFLIHGASMLCIRRRGESRKKKGEKRRRERTKKKGEKENLKE